MPDPTWRWIVYLLLVNIAYMMFTLVRRGLRGNSKYLGELLVLSAVIVQPVWRGIDVTAGHVLLDVVLAGVLVVAPWWLQQRIGSAALSHQFQDYLRFARIKAALAWTRVNDHQVNLGEGLILADTDPRAAVEKVRALRGREDDCERLTRLFLAILLFEQRRFDELWSDLVINGQPWEEYPLIERFYLLRTALEKGNLQTALAIQVALETDPPTDEAELTMVLSARMLFYAFVGSPEEFDALIGQRAPVFATFPPFLVEYWRGTAVCFSGRIDEGLARMAAAVAAAEESQAVDAGWKAQLRRRHRDLQENRETLVPAQIERLREFRAIALPQLQAALTASRGTAAVEPAPAPRQITNALLAANIVVFAVVELSGRSEDIVFLTRWGANSGFLVQTGDWFRLITSQFLHMGWLHLAMNMFALSVLGPPVEQAVGSAILLAIYLSAGIGGAAVSARFSAVPSVGASGAVLGLLTADIVFAQAGMRSGPAGRRRDQWTTLIFILVANLVIGMVERNIDNHAHLGGMATGLVLAGLLVVARRFLGWVAPVAGTAAIAALIAACVALGHAIHRGPGYPARLLEIGHWPIVSDVGGTAPGSVPSSRAATPTVRLSVPCPPGFRQTAPDRQGTPRNPQITLAGPIGERFELLVAPGAGNIASQVAEYLDKRTSAITSEDGVELVSVGGPEPHRLGDHIWYRSWWRVRLGATPIVLVEHLGGDEDVILWNRFTVASDEDGDYRRILERSLGSVTLQIDQGIP